MLASLEKETKNTQLMYIHVWDDYLYNAAGIKLMFKVAHYNLVYSFSDQQTLLKNDIKHAYITQIA